MTVSRRFNHPDGSFAGVVIATIGAEYFSEFYGQFDIGESGTISLVSADGIVLARVPDDDANVGRDVSGGPFFKAVRAGRGFRACTILRSYLDGLQRLGFHQQEQPLSLYRSGHEGAGRGAGAVASCHHHPHGVRSRSGRAHCRHGILPRPAIAARTADGGSACRQGGQFPRGGGRLERHGDPHRAG